MHVLDTMEQCFRVKKLLAALKMSARMILSKHARFKNEPKETFSTVWKGHKIKLE